MNACSDYLKRQMDRYPVLDDKEQLELLKQAQEGDDNARDDLILSNLRLVRTIAQQLGVPVHWEMDDLISEGIQGLSYAIDKFDLNKNVRPSTFFWDAIKWKMLKFKEDVGEPMLSLNATYKAEYEAEDDKTFEYLDKVADPYANNLVKEVETHADLKQMLKYVPHSEQIALILRYGLFGFEQYSLDDIGLCINLTHEGVRQACNRAIEKMQNFPEVPPWYSLVTRKTVQDLVDAADILSKHEKLFSNREKKKKETEVVNDKVEHNYVFKSGTIVTEFQKEFGDQIREEYENGRSIRNLAVKYSCPRSQINKAIVKKPKMLTINDNIEHDYTFKFGRTAPEFQKEFGDQIRADRKTGRSIMNLASKYNCPRSQIRKAIFGKSGWK